METLQITDSIKQVLQYAKGKTLEEKLSQLVLTDMESRLRYCSERLYEFEKKYSLVFHEFAEAWNKDKIPEKYSHEIERDFMEWESLEDEHDLLLSQLREIKERPKQ